MKRYLLPFGLILLVLIFGLRSRHEPSGEPEKESPVPNAVADDLPSVRPADPDPDVVSPALRTQAPQVVTGSEWVQRIVSETWLDGAEEKAGRRRVRIVEANFKYPMLRLEEEVWQDPVSGEDQVKLLRASVADHLMVGRKSGMNEDELRATLSARGFQIRSSAADAPLLVGIPEADTAGAQASAIETLSALDRFIDFAEPDYLVFPCVLPDDPAVSAQKMWGLDNPGLAAGSVADADIDAPEAWDLRHDASSVVVAVTDTGVLYTHEDLQANMWTDGSGRFGFDAYDNDDDPADVGGHGTHCAGTLGARGNNGIGLSGVAWEVQLMALRFIGPEGGTTSDAIRVINYARENGADVISASWGGRGFSQGLENAIRACGDAGIPFVAAAGNDYANNDSTPHFPSSYELSNIVAVTSTDPTDRRSFFSNKGRYSVDIAAPGSEIWSCYVGSDDSYQTLDGTSMATPHVAGALALAKAHFPGESDEDLIARLYSSVDRIPALEGQIATAGRLNLHKLLTASTSELPFDELADALRFDGTYGHWVGTNHKASREADEDSFSLPGTGFRSLWFAWKAPYTGLLEFEVSADAPNLHLIAFKGKERNELETVANSGSQSTRTRTILRFYCKEGQDYRFLVDSSHPSGQTLAVSLGIKPLNDPFSGALTLTGDPFKTAGSNREATAEPFEIENPHAGVGKGRSLWWKWTPDESKRIVITTLGSEFDTVLAVYTGTPESGLVEIASSDDRSALDWTSQVEFDAIAGTQYAIAVDGYRERAAGDILLNGFAADTLTIVEQPGDALAPVGGRDSFEVVAFAGSQVSYQWLFNGQPIPGAESPLLVIDPVRLSDFGTYQVELRNGVEFVVSDPAELVELRVPPEITGSTGNRSGLAGDFLRFSVTAEGSIPITYRWEKDGEPLPDAHDPFLEFPSITETDEGVYTCIATNDVGSDARALSISVVTSPLEGWEWRRESVPGSAITDLRVIEDRVFAVSGDRVLVSEDGHVWSPWRLPSRFRATSLAKLGSTWFCSGTVNGVASMTSSTDGVSWDLPRQVSGVLPAVTQAAPPMRQMEVFDGRLYGWAKDGDDYDDEGFTVVSDDGINWTTVILPDSSELKVRSRMVVGSDRLMVPMGMRMAILQSGSWSQVEVGSQTDLGTAAYVDGAYHVVDDYDIYRSNDGFGWETVAKVDGDAHRWNFDANVVDIGANVVAIRSGSLTEYLWGPSVGDLAPTNLLPSDGHRFTAATVFEGDLIYGTSKGFLHRASSPEEFRLPKGDTIPLDSLSFLNGEFIATGQNSEAVLISGEGVSWREELIGTDPGMQAVSFEATAFADGRYFGAALSQPAVAGWSPRFFSETGPGAGLPGRITSAASNGSLSLAIAQPQASLLYAIDETTGTWSEVTTDFPMYEPLFRVYHLSGQWFLSSGDSVAEQKLTRSTDGHTWTTLPVVDARFLVEFDGKLIALREDHAPIHLRAYSSDNGLDWETLPVSFPGGLPDNWPENRWKILEVEVFEDVITALVEYSAHKDPVLLISKDGSEWFISPTPEPFVDIEVAKGQFMGLTANGGIVHAGPQHPGVSAPRVKIQYPPDQSTHFTGSTVEVSGTAFDPEGLPIEVQCRVNGQLIGVADAGNFSFRFPMEGTEDHVVVVRAVDGHGLVGSDEIKLNSTPPGVSNQLGTGPDVALPVVAWTTFRGMFYAAGTKELFSSADGESWKSLAIPVSAESIHAMAANDQSLVLQFANGDLASTDDGVNWTQSRPVFGIRLNTPLRVSNGWLITSVQGSRSSYVLRSRDGINWQKTTERSEYAIGAIASMANGVLMGLWENEQLRRSTDGGRNWFVVPETADVPRYETGIALGSDRAVAALKDGRVFLSTDGGVEWSLTATLAPLEEAHGYESLAFHADRFLRGENGVWKHISDDGIEWKTLGGEAVQMGPVVRFQGRLLGSGFGGMLWSQGGEQWLLAAGPGHVLPHTLVMTDRYAMVADNDGAVWRTEDGTAWSKIVPGREPVIPPLTSSLHRSMVRHKDVLIAAGSGGALVSPAAGSPSWRRAALDDVHFGDDHWITHLVSDDSRVFAVIDHNPRGSLIDTEVWHSLDGEAWDASEGLDGRGIIDLAAGEGQLMAASGAGELYLSEDGGDSWGALQSFGLVQAWGLTRFANRWVVFGRRTDGSGGTVHSSSDGSDWISHGIHEGEPGQSIDRRLPYYRMAHGQLIYGTDSRDPLATSDGVNWGPLGGQIPSSFRTFEEIVEVADGYLAMWSDGRGRPTGSLMWKLPLGGSEWMEVPVLQPNVIDAELVDGRLFLFGFDSIVEWSTTDAAIDVMPIGPTEAGVGSEIEVMVRVENRGSDPFPAGTYPIDGWLSADGFFGDRNDYPIGRAQVVLPAIASKEVVEIACRFLLPEGIPIGDSHLVLHFDPDESLAEPNRANNVWIADQPEISVAGFTLSLNTIGNGEVERDLGGRFYPRDATVSLAANAGKGAAFAGWGGDALGAENQITILMNGDKTVQANFSARVSLQVRVRGAGQIEGLADLGSYAVGDTANLIASPSEGWVFTGWSGAVSGSAPELALKMDESQSLTASFTLPFEQWLVLHFEPEDLLDESVSGSGADPDGDGFSNRREHLHGSDPNDPESTGVLAFGAEAGYLHMIYTRLSGLGLDVAPVAQATRNLSDWSAPELEERVLETNDGVEVIEARLPFGGEPQGFLRVHYPNDP